MLKTSQLLKQICRTHSVVSPSCMLPIYIYIFLMESPDSTTGPITPDSRREGRERGREKGEEEEEKKALLLVFVLTHFPVQKISV